jgi:hypothetical protein
MSVGQKAEFGSSLSVRSFCRLGSTLSLFGGRLRADNAATNLRETEVGSSFSVRAMSRLGSSLSIAGSYCRLGGAMSMLTQGQIGSSLSVRSFARLGSSLSAAHAGFVGGAFSVVGLARCYGGLSVFNFAHVGSSMSVRSFVRLSSTLSVYDTQRYTYLGNDLKLTQTKKLIFDGNDDYTYFTKSSATQFDMYMANTAGSGSTHQISFNTASGQKSQLHGTWIASTVTSSDERLKTDIRPLYESLSELYKRPGDKSKFIEDVMTLNKSETVSVEREDVVEEPMVVDQKAQAAEVVQQLKPVSYYMKRSSEAKRLRFGFIAQEVEKILPNLVHTDGQGERLKAVYYTDMIAVVTMAIQQQMSITDELAEKVMDHDVRIAVLEKALLELKKERDAAVMLEETVEAVNEVEQKAVEPVNSTAVLEEAVEPVNEVEQKFESHRRAEPNIQDVVVI